MEQRRRESSVHPYLSLETRHTAQEVVRVLRPGGRFLVADWGNADTSMMRLAFLLIQLLDGVATTQKNVEGALPGLFEDSGFESVEAVDLSHPLWNNMSISGTQEKLKHRSVPLTHLQK